MTWTQNIVSNIHSYITHILCLHMCSNYLVDWLYNVHDLSCWWALKHQETNKYSGQAPTSQHKQKINLHTVPGLNLYSDKLAVSKNQVRESWVTRDLLFFQKESGPGHLVYWLIFLVWYRITTLPKSENSIKPVQQVPCTQTGVKHCCTLSSSCSTLYFGDLPLDSTASVLLACLIRRLLSSGKINYKLEMKEMIHVKYNVFSWIIWNLTR